MSKMCEWLRRMVSPPPLKRPAPLSCVVGVRDVREGTVGGAEMGVAIHRCVVEHIDIAELQISIVCYAAALPQVRVEDSNQFQGGGGGGEE